MTPGGEISAIFYVRSGLGRPPVLADSLPTCVLVRNGADTAQVVTVSALPDDGYHASAAIPAGWSVGDTLHLRISAVKSGSPLVAVKRLGALSGDLPATETAILNAIAALNDLDQSDIQAALTAQGYTTVRAALLDELNIATSGSIADRVNKTRKILCNRMEMTGFNTATTRLTVYDDDGVTPFIQWDMDTFGGENVQTQHGVQTHRGAPL